MLDESQVSELKLELKKLGQLSDTSQTISTDQPSAHAVVRLLARTALRMFEHYEERLEELEGELRDVRERSR